MSNEIKNLTLDEARYKLKENHLLNFGITMFAIAFPFFLGLASHAPDQLIQTSVIGAYFGALITNMAIFTPEETALQARINTLEDLRTPKFLLAQ